MSIAVCWNVVNTACVTGFIEYAWLLVQRCKLHWHWMSQPATGHVAESLKFIDSRDNKGKGMSERKATEDGFKLFG